MELFNFQQGHNTLKNEDHYHVDGFCAAGESIEVWAVSAEGKRTLLVSQTYSHPWRFHLQAAWGELVRWDPFQ